MKKIILAMALMSISASAEQMCNVKVCNKLERFSLSPSNWIGDKMGENCFDTVLPKSMAVEGKELSSESRWYQGSFNPTKKSVTRVKRVYSCK
jgi:hypothetical protein